MNTHLSPSGSRRLWILLLGAAIASLFCLAASRDVFIDFSMHARFSELMAQKAFYPPHFLYHGLSILVHALTTFSLLKAGYLVVWTSVLLSFLISFYYLASETKEIPISVVSLLCLSIFFYHPIPIAYLSDQHLYFGYIAANVFHNPTILLLKPLALIHFFFSLSLLNKRNVPVTQTVLLALLTVITLIAKPSYILSFLPAVLLFFAWDYISNPRAQTINYRSFCYSTLIPATAFLTGQFIHTYLTQSGEGLTIAPLSFFRLTSHPASLLPKLISSVAFPLAILFTFFESVKNRSDFRLAVLNLFFSLFYNYCVVEKGIRFSHGNFTWSAQISLFILVLVCLRIFLEQLKPILLEKASTDHSRWGIATCWITLGAHSLAGLVWLLSNLIPGRFHP